MEIDDDGGGAAAQDGAGSLQLQVDKLLGPATQVERTVINALM
jgi:hypothetical protein